LQLPHKTADLEVVTFKIKEEADTIILLRDGNVIYFGNIRRENSDGEHNDSG
jgi:hypothetical protein